MVVAVIPVRVMQVPAHEVAQVIAVRHRLVATALAVHVIARVVLAAVPTFAVVRIFGPDLDRAVVDVIVVQMVQVAAVYVVHVLAVANRGMAAAFAVNVAVV